MVAERGIYSTSGSSKSIRLEVQATITSGEWYETDDWDGGYDIDDWG